MDGASSTAGRSDVNGESAHGLRALPVGLDVRDRRCVVVGGGEVGTRKVRTLLRAGAAVILVAPHATNELERLVETGEVRWTRREYREPDLDGTFLVVAATDDEGLNATIARSARDRGALVCDASSADRSDVTFGALLDLDGVTVGVFTGGRDPARARTMRDWIASLVHRVRPAAGADVNGGGE